MNIVDKQQEEKEKQKHQFLNIPKLPLPKDNITVKDILRTLDLDNKRVNDNSNTDYSMKDLAQSKKREIKQKEEINNNNNNNNNYHHNNFNLSNEGNTMDASSLLLEVEMLLQHSPLSEKEKFSVQNVYSNNFKISEAQMPEMNAFSNSHFQTLLSPSLSSATEITPINTKKNNDYSIVSGVNSNEKGIKTINKHNTGMKFNNNNNNNNNNKMEVKPPDAFSTQWWRFRESYYHDTMQQKEQKQNDQKEESKEEKEYKSFLNTDDLNKNSGIQIKSTDHNAPRVTFIEPLASTSVVYQNKIQTHANNNNNDNNYYKDDEATVVPSEDKGKPSTFDYDNNKDHGEAIRDIILSLKEARRLRRMQFPTADNNNNNNNNTNLSFFQRLKIPRSIHQDTNETLKEGMQLLLQERKWITMRCTIIYDRIQQVQHHRTVMMNRLKEVCGEKPIKFLMEA